MSVESVNWALKQSVGNGILKATLVSIACLDTGGPIARADVVSETGLKIKTIHRHIRLLAFLGFVESTPSTVTLKVKS